MVLLCSAVICAVICQFPVVTSSENWGSTVFHWIASEKDGKIPRLSEEHFQNNFGYLSHSRLLERKSPGYGSGLTGPTVLWFFYTCRGSLVFMGKL